ncbi:hypothetical protein DSO57_1003448 [Entomophthora muscae]|uniref:Uncharacterized protein n=1 Tax=Entomophthora muscae TaxID=34485 RepID=A0ACC2UIH7_9FUNG|nr:hypothetical protein DSO57_1003448 [Entomophthora muscae]
MLIIEDDYDLTNSSFLTKDLINKTIDCPVKLEIANDVSPFIHMIALVPVGTSGIDGSTYLIK